MYGCAVDVYRLCEAVYIVTVLGFVKIVRAIVQEEVKGEKDSQLSVGGAMAIVGLLMMH